MNTTKKKYYKYVDFEQPTLSSDGTLGEGEFAVSASEYGGWGYAYNAINDNTNDWHTAASGTPRPYIIYTKTPVKATSFNFRNRVSDSANTYPTSSITIYGSNDNSSWTQIASTTNSVTSAGGAWSCAISEENQKFYTYYKINFYNSYSYSAMNYIQLVGKYVTEGTSTDYDYYIEVSIPLTYKAVKETVRKYYKYVYSSWEQPTLTANGTIGKDSFAVSTTLNTPAYYAFDNNSDTYCRQSGGGASTGSNIIVYSKNELKVSSIYLDQSGHSDNEQCGGDIYASKDGATYTIIATFSQSLTQTVTISTEEYYSYFKFVNTTATSSGYWNNRQITLYASDSRYSVESTAEDYDYYIDTDVYKLPKTEDKYYGIVQ